MPTCVPSSLPFLRHDNCTHVLPRVLNPLFCSAVCVQELNLLLCSAVCVQELSRGVSGPAGRVALSLPSVSFEATGLGLGVGPVAGAPAPYPSAPQYAPSQYPPADSLAGAAGAVPQ